MWLSLRVACVVVALSWSFVILERRLTRDVVETVVVFIVLILMLLLAALELIAVDILTGSSRLSVKMLLRVSLFAAIVFVFVLGLLSYQTFSLTIASLSVAIEMVVRVSLERLVLLAFVSVPWAVPFTLALAVAVVGCSYVAEVLARIWFHVAILLGFIRDSIRLPIVLVSVFAVIFTGCSCSIEAIVRVLNKFLSMLVFVFAIKSARFFFTLAFAVVILFSFFASVIVRIALASASPMSSGGVA